MKSDLKYSGKLSIKLGRKRRKLYNKGNIDLFKLFANALVGQHINTSIPDTFLIVNNEDKELFKIAIQKMTLIDNGITARYSGYLATPVDSNLESVKIKLVKINDQTIESDFAEINVTDADDNLAILKSITNEKSALLEWDLTVNNNEGDRE